MLESQGEVLDELRELASRVPFDERGNPDIKIEDISTLLLREYLVKVGSKLANELYTKPLESILEQMDLYVGPKENRMRRNVAAMMFCEDPSKFFKCTQVEVVYFPDGRLNNPNNLYEGPIIKGSITQIIDRTLEYLNRMHLKSPPRFRLRVSTSSGPRKTKNIVVKLHKQVFSVSLQ